MTPVRELFESFRANFTVDDRLLAGIDLDAPDLWALIGNFARSGFYWTGQVNEWQSVLAGNLQGDCKSLVDACLHLARDGFGFEVDFGYTGSDIFVPGGGAITDGRTGNVDHGSSWVFTNHYWLETAAFGPIDLLFCGVAAEQNWIEETESGKEQVTPREVADWRRFGDWVLYFVGPGDPSHTYTTNKDEAYRSPSRSEEARLEDEALSAASTSADDGVAEDPLAALLPEVQEMTQGLDEESQRWTAQVILAAELPTFIARKSIYAQFGSANIMNPQFDRDRWEQWKLTQTS